MREIRSFKALDNPTFDYEISSVTDEEVWKRMDTALVADLLNEHLPLSRYGTVRELGFIPVALAVNDREQFIMYNTDSREISISLCADYAGLLEAASPEEGTAIVARLLLAAVPYFAQAPVPGFQISAFRQDLESLLQRRGWLNGPLPNLEARPLFIVWSDNYHPAPPGPSLHFFSRRIGVRECFDLIDPAPFTQLLNARVHLPDFGPGLSEIYLTFQADEPDPAPDKMHLEYYPTDRELHLTLPLSTRRLLREDRRGTSALMAEALLAAGPRMEREGIVDFAVRAFVGKVEEVV